MRPSRSMEDLNRTHQKLNVFHTEIFDGLELGEANGVLERHLQFVNLVSLVGLNDVIHVTTVDLVLVRKLGNLTGLALHEHGLVGIQVTQNCPQCGTRLLTL